MLAERLSDSNTGLYGLHHLDEELKRRLVAEYEFKEQNGYLRDGRCPQCGKRELYAKADAYLKMDRGFDLALVRGWYEQGRFWHPGGDKGSATVRFPLNGSAYMERFVEAVTITDRETGARKERKAHFQGPHRGLAWMPPGMKIEDGDEVWLVEGILDAIALHHHGIKAAAVLSCVNYPETWLGTVSVRGVTWVWALDNDSAGREWTRKQMQRMRAKGLRCAAAQSSETGGPKRDWNDLHLLGQLKERDLERYRYYGDLYTAASTVQKGLLIYRWKGTARFAFEYRDRLYLFEWNQARYDKTLEEADPETARKAEEAAAGVRQIGNCYPEPLYFMRNAMSDESWYFFRVSSPQGAAAKNTFTGSQLASAKEFKKRLLAIAPGAYFTGTDGVLDLFMEPRFSRLKTVETVDFIGYSKEHGAYIFPPHCVRDGRLYSRTDEDYFDTPKLAIRSLNQSVRLHINAEPGDFSGAWVGHLWDAFGPAGMAALAFWAGTLFAEQIRAMHKSFPFLEVVGDAGAGKTTLIEFLWKLFGREDYEGFDPSKSTLAGRARNFSQVANLPIVLIEGDHGEDTAHSRRFDWEETKTAYNGRSVRARGLKNAGNETYEPPFRGALVISQNSPVSASEAILSRIIHLHFTRSAHSVESRHAAEALEQTPVESVSGFLLRASGVVRLNQEDLVSDVGPDGWEVAYLRVTEKGGNERFVPVPDDAFLLLRAYLAHGEFQEIDRTTEDGSRVLFISTRNHSVPAHEYFGENRRLRPYSVWRIIQRYGKLALIPNEVRHPHALRHMYGRELAEGGIDLDQRAALLGHRDLKTTRIYDRMSVGRLREAVKRAGPMSKIRTPVSPLRDMLRSEVGVSEP